MNYYKLLIGGEEVNTGNCLYYIKAEDLIRRPFFIVAFITKFKTVARWLGFGRMFYAKCAMASNKDVELAIDLAFRERKHIYNVDRGLKLKIINDFREELKRKQPSILQILINEGHNKQLAEFELDYLFEKILTNDNATLLLDALEQKSVYNKDYIIRQPYGVFGLITPYNGPLIAATIVLMSAILSGNACIVKPPRDFPISTFELVKLLSQIIKNNKAPAGWVSIILGDSRKILDVWLESAKVHGIIFFGSSNHGLDIAARGCQKGKKVILELSGSDASLVWGDADLEQATDDIVKSRFIASGQFCIAIKRVFIHKKVYDKVVNLLLDKIKRLKIGLPSDPETTEIPIGRLEIIKKLKDVLRDAESRGAKVVAGGRFVDCNDKIKKRGFFLRPTIVTGVTNEMRLMKEEVFGPILPLVKIKSYQEAVSLINESQYGLRASIWAKDNKIIDSFIDDINVGSIIVNDEHYYMGVNSPHLGGTKASGITGAKYFTEEMCYKKYIHRS